MHKSLRTILFCAGLVACAASCRAGSMAASSVAGTDRVIPTRYNADRFFATAVLPRGDTAMFFLDTGSGTYAWDVFIPYLELSVKDTITNARGGKTGLAPFPVFRADASLPTAITQTPQGTGLLVYPIDWHAQNNFGAWIIRESQGQLGSNWFNGRVWTIDYPNRRVVLRNRSSANDGEPGREQPFYFPTDSAGRRVGQTGSVDVVIDGDTVAMLMDTGATIWLSSAALARVGDGGPSERSSTHIDNWLFARLRERHPDWPVIERADLWLGALTHSSAERVGRRPRRRAHLVQRAWRTADAADRAAERARMGEAPGRNTRRIVAQAFCRDTRLPAWDGALL